MALKEKLNRYPKKQVGQPPEKAEKGALRPFPLGIILATSFLAGCTPSSAERILTSSPVPTPTPTPTLEPTPTPTLSSTPTPELGATIPEVEVGETLAIGGLNWEIKEFNTDEITQLLGEGFKEWTIIGGENNVFFNIASYDAKGRYHLILPHAPSNYQWDGENQVWTNPQNPNEILFPQVALPGGWNEERQIAGPTAIPDMAVMLKDPNGNIQVGVIYQNEVLQQAGINPQMNPESYLLLSDGRYLYLGPPKNLTLQQGQTIEAVYDENSQLRYHRIINPDGSWFMVLTSWDQVINPQQAEHMFEVIGIQVGEEITSIPYPQDEIVNKLNIKEYGKLEDGTYVAYKTITDEQTGQTKKLVVAQAVFETNNNGEIVFREWQQTIPLENLAVPDPRITNPELFDLTNREAPIPQFVNAMQEIGINIDPQDIITELGNNHETRQGSDGKTYILTTYTVEGQNGARYSMGLIADQDEKGEWRWRELIPRIIDNLFLANDFGVLLNDQDYRNPYLSRIASVIWEQPFTRTWVENHGRNQINKLMELLQFLDRPTLYMHPGMWHLDIDSNLRHASSREEVINYIKWLAHDYMRDAKRAYDITGKTVMINFANEPWWADPPNNPVNVGWLESPYYRYLGRDYLVEGYIAFYNAGIENGLRPGEDFRLILSVDGIFFPNQKLDLAINTIQTMKREISNRLGIPVENVQIDLAIQWRFDPTVTGGQMSNEGRYRMPTEDELRTALRKIREAGIPFHIVEFEVANTPNEEYDRILQTLSQLAVENGALTITYGGLSHTEINPFTDIRHPVYENGHPTFTYYAYLSLLYSLLESP